MSERAAGESDPLAVRSRVVVVLVLPRRPAALFCWTALVGEGSRGRSRRFGTVKRVGWVESGRVVALQGTVDAGISPRYYLQRSQQRDDDVLGL